MSTHKVFRCMRTLDSRNSRIIASVLSKAERQNHLLCVGALSLIHCFQEHLYSCCHNNLPQIQWLRTTQIYHFYSQRSKMHLHSSVPFGGSGGESVYILVHFLKAACIAGLMAGSLDFCFHHHITFSDSNPPDSLL